MELEALCRSKPAAYHLTARAHLDRLRRLRVLESAERLCEAAHRRDLLEQRRVSSEQIVVNGDRILIRDQRPLFENRMDLDGRPLAALLQDLNRRVFFWAGSSSGPGDYGQAHFRRYQTEHPVVLRVPMPDLLACGTAELCRYNSGAPRHWSGRPSPRGANTFVPISKWSEAPGRVVEVTFINCVDLPLSTEWSDNPTAGWQRLFDGNEIEPRGQPAR